MDPVPLTGPMPSAVHPPSGCPFHTRCWKADDACAASTPDARRAGGEHRYRCHQPVGDGEATRDLVRQAAAPAAPAPAPTAPTAQETRP